jgi:transcriptional regulator
MFVRSCWEPRTQSEIFELIDTYPWALVVNNGNDGPLVTNMPLLLDRSRGQCGVLVGHIARANRHAEILQKNEKPTLAVFEGPYSYVTGSWYPNRDMPSTYYYTAVHCYGNVRLQPTDELERWIGVLTERMERQIPNGWKTSDIEYSGITRRLNHILGFEIEIDRMEGKFKLGQDEPKKDAIAVAGKLAEASEASHRVLSEMTRHYNEDRTEN